LIIGSYLPSPSARISTLYYRKDIFINRQIIMALKLKIIVQYIIDTMFLVSIPIRPSLASSSSMVSSSDSLNPERRLRSCFFIFPWADSSHRIFSRKLCEGSIISRTVTIRDRVALATKMYLDLKMVQSPAYL